MTLSSSTTTSVGSIHHSSPSTYLYASTVVIVIGLQGYSAYLPPSPVHGKENNGIHLYYSLPCDCMKVTITTIYYQHCYSSSSIVSIGCCCCRACGINLMCLNSSLSLYIHQDIYDTLVRYAVSSALAVYNRWDTDTVSRQ